MTNYIEVKNVTFDYENGDVLSRGVKEVNLTINEGEFVVFLGHNGSGKSTLAKLLNGFLTPKEGEIFVDGIDTRDESKIYDIRTRIGMVFQNPDNQMVASIVEDDLAFGPENLGVPREEIIRRVEYSLEAVNMTKYKTHTPFKLSGGQKQRIAIAAMLCMIPKVLILDEATAMLDPKGRKDILNILKKLNKDDNMTIILITHYMDETIDADRIIVMNEGKIIANGAPKDIFADTKMLEDAKLDLPIATKVSKILKENGIKIDSALKDEELVEQLCQLK